jgi:hypothetical protein
MEEKGNLRKILSELAIQGIPESTDLWPRIRDRLQRISLLDRLKRRTALPGGSWLILALGIALVIGLVLNPGNTQAASFIARIMEHDKRVMTIDLDKGIRLNEPRTIQGVTVTLFGIHGNEEYLILEYAVQSPSGQRFEPRDERLLETVCYAWDGTYGFNEDTHILHLNLPAEETGYLAIFRNKCRFPPKQLHFELYVQEVIVPPSVSSDANSGQVLEPVPAGRIIGPFEFSIEVPTN